MTSNKSIIKIKRLIGEAIVHKKDDSLKNHIATFWARRTEYSGKVDDHGFVLWRYNWRTGGICYQVVTGNFLITEKKVTINLTMKTNSAGLLFFIPFSIFWCTIWVLALTEDGNFMNNFISRSFGCLLAFSIIFVPYIWGSRIEKEELTCEIEYIIQEKKIPN
jgi:hypothetical protein